MKLAIIIFSLILSSCALPGKDIEMRAKLTSLYGESEIYEAFYLKLRKAIVSGYKEAVAKLNAYPIRVNIDSTSVYYKTAREFVANYSQIITSEMQSRVKKSDFKDLFANSYGMHIGLGDIWFTGYCIGKITDSQCDDVKVNVTTYNVIHIAEK